MDPREARESRAAGVVAAFVLAAIVLLSLSPAATASAEVVDAPLRVDRGHDEMSVAPHRPDPMHAPPVAVLATLGTFPLLLADVGGEVAAADSASKASTVSLSVQGDANIFGAGHLVPPEPGGFGAGTLPPGLSFAAGPGQELTVTNVTGCVTMTVGFGYCDGGDGSTFVLLETNITSYGGISGIAHDTNGFLVGVFLDPNEPRDPAPPVLDFRGSALGTNFSTLSPVVGQTFFVGDGLMGTGVGSTQRFTVPPTATRLYLGFGDAYGYQGPPGAYADNGGSLNATVVLAAVVNRAPIADAGPDQATVRNAMAILDGSGSFDPDGDPITFSWTEVASPNSIPITNAHASVASVAPTMVGTYTFNLTVTDDQAASAYDWVDIVVLNQGPVANAGSDQGTFKNTLVTLDGSASLDRDGDPLTYSWSQVAGPLPVVLGNPDTAMASFTTPSGASASGQYVFSLAVLDSFGGNDADEVNVTVSNRPPSADAGPDQTVSKKTLVTLDGTLSADPDADPLSFEWWLVFGPAGVAMAGANTAAPTFTPSMRGVYTFEVNVTDGDGGVSRDTVDVHATNADPIANAGPDQLVALGAAVRLDGSRSSDSDGDPIAFSWVQMSGPAVSLTGPDGPRPSFVPDGAGVYVFRLTIGDGDGGDASDEVTITVTGVATAIGVEVFAALVIVIIVAIVLVLLFLGWRRRKSDPAEEPEPRD